MPGYVITPFHSMKDSDEVYLFIQGEKGLTLDWNFLFFYFGECPSECIYEEVHVKVMQGYKNGATYYARIEMGAEQQYVLQRFSKKPLVIGMFHNCTHMQVDDRCGILWLRIKRTFSDNNFQCKDHAEKCRLGIIPLTTPSYFTRNCKYGSENEQYEMFYIHQYCIFIPKPNWTIPLKKQTWLEASSLCQKMSRSLVNIKDQDFHNFFKYAIFETMEQVVIPLFIGLIWEVGYDKINIQFIKNRVLFNDMLKLDTGILMLSI